MDYSDATLLGQFLQRALTANETSLLTTALPAIKKWIDRYLSTQFDNVAPSTRYFEGCGKSLDIDPCQEISLVQSLDPYNISYYSYQTFEIVYEPINETIKREIRLRYGTWPEGTSNLGVTAKFTEYDYVNSKVPEDIQVASTRLAAGIINAGKIAKVGGNIHREMLEGHLIQYDITPNSMAAIAKGDPILQGILDARKEVMIW